MTPSYRYRSLRAFFEEALFRSWWVFVFCIVCFALYEHAMQRQHRDHALLEGKLYSLEAVKAEEHAVNEDLLLQINSQSDYCWIELTLIKVLGLVPEGSTKVYFTR